MNAHQRRIARRECFRTMLPGTELRLRNSRGRYTTVTVVAPVMRCCQPHVQIEQRYDYSQQVARAVIPFTSILAYRRPA